MDWIDPRDRMPMGDAETIVDCGDTVLLGLVVPARDRLRRAEGMLAVKCERVGGALRLVSLAIADTPLVVDTTALHSNPRRVSDDEDGTGR